MNPWIIILGGVFVIFGMGAVWLAVRRRSAQLKSRSAMAELRQQWELRRSAIPLLVERYKRVAGKPSARVGAIIQKRAEANECRDPALLEKKERELSAMLVEFFKENGKNAELKKDILWLEAKQEIEKLSV